MKIGRKMNSKTSGLPPFYNLSHEVAHARASGSPIVALESAVITHGLPFPYNLNLAQELEGILRGQGVTPATIAVVKGVIQVGLSAQQLETLVNAGSDLRKISTRDFARVIAKCESGGTTVAGTMLAAYTTGIQVFATGGIGGVHRRDPVELKPRSTERVFSQRVPSRKSHLVVPSQFDISADLPQLASTPIIVVCAGAKAILDLPATLEYLETYGVPVVGYQTDDFPAFYARSCGLPVSVRAETAEEVVAIARAHWAMGLRSAVLVTVPPPAATALPNDVAQQAIWQALEEASLQKVHGQAVTPFLLKRVSELTQGESLQANLGLLRNNVQVAAQIARFLRSDLHLQKA